MRNRKLQASKPTLMRLLILAVLIFSGLLTAQNLTDENGLKQGVWSKDYPWGSPRYEGAFKDGKETGLFKFYDQNGKVVSQRFYETPGGISDAVMYLPKGGVEAIGKLDGKNKVGEWKYFSTKGYLVSTEQYTKGLKDGLEKVFYSDSTTAELTTWVNGTKNGAWKKYGMNGSVEKSAIYVGGQLHGVSFTNYPSGRKKIKGYYKKGLKNGKWFYYADNGVQEKMEIYEFGDLINND